MLGSARFELNVNLLPTGATVVNLILSVVLTLKLLENIEPFSRKGLLVFFYDRKYSFLF